MAASKKETTSKSEIAEQNAKNTLPKGMEDMEADAGAGMEDADSESYSIPFLRVLQDLSPQVKKQRAEFIPGAEAGMVLNTVTDELFGADASEDQPGIVVVPCYYRRAMVEWKPRDEGGGFVAEHPVGVEKNLDRDGGKFITDEGNEIQDTRYHYVLLVHESGAYEPALITMSSTQIRASKKWMSAMNGIKFRNSEGKMFTPPSFSHKYRMQTQPQSNDQGDWYGWQITNEGAMQAEDMELYQAAKAFRDAVKSGEVKEQQPESETAGATSDQSEF